MNVALYRVLIADI